MSWISMPRKLSVIPFFIFFFLQIEQIYPDPVGVVSIGQKVVHLLSDPENKEWLSTSTELCGCTCTYKVMSVLK
jgi:hypothetical protein